MELAELVPKLENRRVRIAYDSPYAAINLLFYHILPNFPPERVHFVIYSDVVCRRLRETYESIRRESPEVAETLEGVKLVKIGEKKCFPFGSECVKNDGISIPESKFFGEEFLRIARRARDDDVFVFVGFYIIPAIYGIDAVRHIYRFFSCLPEKITVFSLYSEDSLDNLTNKLMEKLYDVVIRINKESHSFGEDVYLLGIEQSIVREIRPGFARFRIGKNGRLESI
ncbi:hypothetical protein [Archaeoglobus veneficus]|uniref:MEDS domain-containing protein n=1 Tax=Archaeoglobus veneficus (strain DSM 11195 / SNP6) TaxID=693661 RepID=F2KQN8_ARCVS|nr:hypothetical protein [Archaeoglobus veneficus]AEA46600.1 hypothetical protein Arcve_0579 [Archaeoglobus veneficus SNP6]